MEGVLWRGGIGDTSDATMHVRRILILCINVLYEIACVKCGLLLFDRLAGHKVRALIVPLVLCTRDYNYPLLLCTVVDRK